MKVFDSIKQASDFLKKGAAITIGNFDGLHLGHRHIVESLCVQAKKRHVKSVVLTFDPHPVKVFSPRVAPPLINTVPQKIELFKQTDLDCLIIQKFDLNFAKTTAQNFFYKLLKEQLHAKYISVGYDFTFGKDRSGTTEALELMGYKEGIDVDIIDAQYFKKKTLVSSTVIRNLVLEGQVDLAESLLTRTFFVEGKVVHGHKRGAELGIHTANLKTENELIPQDGVYATLVEFQNKTYKSVTNIGYNPTFENEERSIEAHIFDFDKDIYNKVLKLHFVKKLRDEKRFHSPQELVAQIQKDIKEAKSVLKKHE